jgi:hypothetical protein
MAEGQGGECNSMMVLQGVTALACQGIVSVLGYGYTSHPLQIIVAPPRIIVTPPLNSHRIPLIKRTSRGCISHGHVYYGRVSHRVYISLGVYLTSVYFIPCTVNVSYSLISFKRLLPGAVPSLGTWPLLCGGLVSKLRRSLPGKALSGGLASKLWGSLPRGDTRY